MKHHQSGFTLVEIAIVLVIVGLLLGAVLKGQELIFNSKVKATWNLSKEVAAAIYAYQDRYKVLPGDDPQATTRFPSVTPTPVNGNGNGLITGVTDCSTGVSSAENCQLLYHLRLSGLLSGERTTSLRHAFGGRAEVGPANANGLGASFGSQLAMHFAANTLTRKAAQALDAGFDDGNPTTGSFRCAGITTYDMTQPEANVAGWCAVKL